MPSSSGSWAQTRRSAHSRNHRLASNSGPLGRADVFFTSGPARSRRRFAGQIIAEATSTSAEVPPECTDTYRPRCSDCPSAAKGPRSHSPARGRATLNSHHHSVGCALEAAVISGVAKGAARQDKTPRVVGQCEQKVDGCRRSTQCSLVAVATAPGGVEVSRSILRRTEPPEVVRRGAPRRRRRRGRRRTTHPRGRGCRTS